MKKSSRLEEYKKGYGLIRDGELNGLFEGYLTDLKAAIVESQKQCTFYAIIFFDNTRNRVNCASMPITNLKSDGKKPSELSRSGAKIARDFIQNYPNQTALISIFCLAGEWQNKNPFKGLLLTAQTADGRCCMAWYKVITDDNDKIVDFEVIEEHIPKKHINDEDYEWDGNTAFFEEVDRLTNK
jgi:hypothetical protein